MATVRFSDVLYFLAELAVYTAVVWWGLSRDASTPVRWLLATGGLSTLAISWGLVAAPRAIFALHGVGDVAFRVAWFGCGLIAAVIVISAAVRAA